MDALKFGTAIRDITPSYPVWAHGYAGRNRRSSGVLERLSLGCLAVDNGQTKVLIFAFDMIGFRKDVCEDLYTLLEQETGVAYPNLMISGSHTHFAPALQGTTLGDPEVGFVDPDPDYVNEVKVKLVEAAHEALGKRKSMRLETARIQVPQVVFNRRTVRKSDGIVEMNLLYPEDASPYTFSPVDSELTVHRVVDENGVQAVLTNFGCHPVTGCSPEEDYYRFSADYPYYMRQTISEAWHCPVFFTLGAAGDAVPMNRKGDSRERIGSILGHATVLAERTFRVDSSLNLSADSVTLDVETIVQTHPETAEAEYEDARSAVLSAQDKKGEMYRDQVHTFRDKMMVCSRARLYPQNKAEIQVQFVRIGRSVLVGLGFEVLAEASLKMKTRFPNSVLVSCCGGYQGYLPLAYEYDRGGYEATESSTHFVPGTADRVLDAIFQWLEKEAI